MTNKQEKVLIVIGGPTASGKTEIAIRLARHFGTEIVSCDSRQFFREMTIGTAKPSQEELKQAPHHFINSLSIEDAYSVGDYERDVLFLLEKLFSRKDVVIMAGGSGLYQKAVTEGLDEFPEVPTGIRQKIEKQYEEKGLESLQSRLKEVDPEYYLEVDLQNPHRLIRALAVYEASGQAFSAFRKNTAGQRSFFTLYLELSWDRALLYERINKRVDLMMQNGLLEEARTLYPRKALTPLQTVGYQELFDYFDGKIKLEEAVELIKRNSRRYAKRQMTWSRRDGHWKHFAPSEWEHLLEYVQRAIEGQWHFKKVAPDEHQQEDFLKPTQCILFLDANDKKIGHFHLSEKKYKIYHGLWIDETYWGSREEYFFLHEIFHRMQNKDQVQASDRLQPFFLQKGLIAYKKNYLGFPE